PTRPTPTWAPRRRTHLGTVLRTRAARHIAWLATAGRSEPEGALGSACLLHLAHREEAAHWRCQFSVGAGSTTSALVPVPDAQATRRTPRRRPRGRPVGGARAPGAHHRPIHPPRPHAPALLGRPMVPTHPDGLPLPDRRRTPPQGRL